MARQAYSEKGNTERTWVWGHCLTPSSKACGRIRTPWDTVGGSNYRSIGKQIQSLQPATKEEWEAEGDRVCLKRKPGSQRMAGSLSLCPQDSPLVSPFLWEMKARKKTWRESAAPGDSWVSPGLPKIKHIFSPLDWFLPETPCPGLNNKYDFLFTHLDTPSRINTLDLMC